MLFQFIFAHGFLFRIGYGGILDGLFDWANSILDPNSGSGAVTGSASTTIAYNNTRLSVNITGRAIAFDSTRGAIYVAGIVSASGNHTLLGFPFPQTQQGPGSLTSYVARIYANGTPHWVVEIPGLNVTNVLPEPAGGDLIFTAINPSYGLGGSAFSLARLSATNGSNVYQSSAHVLGATVYDSWDFLVDGQTIVVAGRLGYQDPTVTNGPTAILFYNLTNGVYLRYYKTESISFLTGIAPYSIPSQYCLVGNWCVGRTVDPNTFGSRPPITEPYHPSVAVQFDSASKQHFVLSTSLAGTPSSDSYLSAHLDNDNTAVWQSPIKPGSNYTGNVTAFDMVLIPGRSVLAIVGYATIQVPAKTPGVASISATFDFVTVFSLSGQQIASYVGPTTTTANNFVAVSVGNSASTMYILRSNGSYAIWPLVLPAHTIPVNTISLVSNVSVATSQVPLPTPTPLVANLSSNTPNQPSTISTVSIQSTSSSVSSSLAADMATFTPTPIVEEQQASIGPASNFFALFKNLSLTIMIALAIAALFVVVLIFSVCYLCCVRRRARNPSSMSESSVFGKTSTAHLFSGDLGRISTNTSFFGTAFSSIRGETTMGNTTNMTTMMGRTLMDTAHVMTLPGFFEVAPGVDFNLKDLLAQGGGGTIHIGEPKSQNLKERAQNERIIVKVITESPDVELAQEIQKVFEQEVAMMYFFRENKLFAQLLGYCSYPKMLVVKYYALGTLERMIYHNDVSWNRKIALRFGRNIADALDAMHSNGFAHCDLKPANVLISNSTTGSGAYCILTDFGVSQIFDSKRLLVQAFQKSLVEGASLMYAAPEVLRMLRSGNVDPNRSPAFVKARDIFAFGVLTLEMITRRHLTYTG